MFNAAAAEEGKQMSDCKVHRIMTGSLGENCFLVQNSVSGEVFLVDPGDDAQRIKDLIRRIDGDLRAILLTHGHQDHIGAVEELRDGVPVYALESEKELLADEMMNLSGMHIFGGNGGCSITADCLVSSGEKLKIAGFLVEVIATPGHTAGSCCYYLPEEGILFSGDTLFEGSVGRSDLPTGDEWALLASIREKLMVLPDNTAVMPGHGGYTSIGRERTYNPFLR